MLLAATTILSEGFRNRLPVPLEATAIELLKPELCKQRNLIQPLKLPCILLLIIHVHLVSNLVCSILHLF